MLIAKAIADTPKKKPEGEYHSVALELAVTYTTQSSYAQSRRTARRSRTATAPVKVERRKLNAWIKSLLKAFVCVQTC